MGEIRDTYQPSTRRTPFVPPAQPEPVSLDEAVAELERLKLDIVGIDHQLGDLDRTDAQGNRLTQDAWNEWRQKALAARRFKMERKSFLRAWLAKHSESKATQRMKVDFLGIPTVVIARRLAKRVGQLEGVFYAARQYCAEPGEATQRELTDRVARAVRFLDDGDEE